MVIFKFGSAFLLRLNRLPTRCKTVVDVDVDGDVDVDVEEEMGPDDTWEDGGV